MKNYELPFTCAKKDKNGYATLLVKFGEWLVPVKGRPLPLSKKDVSETQEEINRLNLTRWNLKDIPEIAKIVGVLCGDSEDYTPLLYWNGNGRAWKFYDEGLGGIDDDSDEVIDKLDEKIDELEGVFYEPHVDEEGNYGDEAIHAVYQSLGSDVGDYDPDYDPEDPTGDELDPVEFIKNIPAKIGLARKQHKKLPYEEIGEEAYEIFSTVAEDGGYTELGQMLYRLVKELRDNV